MKKTAIVLALALALGGAAMAGTDKDTGEVCQGSTCNSGGAGGQGGTGIGVGIGVGVAKASARASATQSNSQSMTYNEAYTPNAYAPTIGATVPCLVPISGGVGVPGASVSLGSGVIDTGCEQREVVRLGLSSSDAAVKAKANRVLENQLDAILAEDEEKPAVAPGPAEQSRQQMFELEQLGG